MLAALVGGQSQKAFVVCDTVVAGVGAGCEAMEYGAGLLEP